MGGAFRDFRHSLRLLRRTPGFSAVAILVLALGIGANTAVFSVVDALVLRPRLGRIDTLEGVFSQDRTKPDSYRDFSYPEYVDLREQGGVFESLMAHTFSTVGIREGDLTRQTFAAIVSANYFDTLGVHLAAGRTFTADEERPGAAIPVAIASYSLWRRGGLSPSFIGSIVHVNGTDFTVVGVAPRGFSGTMTLVSPQWWFPLGTYDAIVNEMFKQRSTGLMDRRNFAVNIAGALEPGTTAASAERELNAFAARLAKDYPDVERDRTLQLAALPRMSVSSRPHDPDSMTALSGLLMLMSSLVLVVACLNLANLLLARGSARRREIAIRQAIGSGRAQIVRQLLVEGFVLATIGSAVGVVVAWWATKLLAVSLSAPLASIGIEIVIEPSARIVVAAAGFALFSTLFFALGPAWSLSKPALAGDLKGEPIVVGGRFATGPVLVVVQLAVSLALVSAGGLFVRAAANVARADAGFALEHQLVISLDPSLAGYKEPRVRSTYQAALDRVRSTPGVVDASFGSIVPFGEITEGRDVRASSTADPTNAIYFVVGSRYFETLGLGMLRGREFTAAEEQSGAGPRVAIVDRRLAARLFGAADAVGRTILINQHDNETREAFTIVGVAPELMHDLFETAPEPHVFVPYGSKYNPAMTLHVRTAAGVPDDAMLATLRGELMALDSQLPIIHARTMTGHRDASIAAWSVRAAATLFSVFGALAMLLAAIGVYGLKAYDVAKRTREIGIRVALGATSRDVARMMLGESAKTTAIGTALGLLLALGLGQVLRGILYRVSPLDPVVVLTAAIVLGGTAMAACYLPARRASRLAPLDALRTE